MLQNVNFVNAFSKTEIGDCMWEKWSREVVPETVQPSRTEAGKLNTGWNITETGLQKSKFSVLTTASRKTVLVGHLALSLPVREKNAELL